MFGCPRVPGWVQTLLSVSGGLGVMLFLPSAGLEGSGGGQMLPGSARAWANIPPSPSRQDGWTATPSRPSWAPHGGVNLCGRSWLQKAVLRCRPPRCLPPQSRLLAGQMEGRAPGPLHCCGWCQGWAEGEGHCQAHCKPDNTGRLDSGPLCQVMPQHSACITPMGSSQSAVWSECHPHPFFKWGK